MNVISRNPVLFFVLLLVIVGLAFGVSFDDIKRWLGADQIDGPDSSSMVQQQSADTVNATASSGISVPKIAEQLELAEVRLLVASLPREQQQQLLSNPEVFSSFIKRQLAQKSMLGLVKADAIENQPAIEYLMTRSAENALLEWYLKQLIEKNIPAGFPQEEQIQAFYDENKDTFVIGERMHLWQIFIPVADSSSSEQILNAESQAHSVHSELQSGSRSFADAAFQYSKHSPSRENGGYVGMVKLSDLPESIQATTRQLQENEISTPIQTADGFHIVRRGSVVAEQAVGFDQIRSRIVEVLKKQAVENIRISLVEKSQEQFPSEVTDHEIEEWRLKLRSGL